MNNMNKRKILFGTLLGGLALCLGDSAAMTENPYVYKTSSAMKVKPDYRKLTHDDWLKKMDEEAEKAEEECRSVKHSLKGKELKIYKRIAARANKLFPNNFGMSKRLSLAMYELASRRSIMESEFNVKILKECLEDAEGRGAAWSDLFIVPNLSGINVSRGIMIWTYMEALLGRSGNSCFVERRYDESSCGARWTVNVDEKNNVVSGGMQCRVGAWGDTGLSIDMGMTEKLMLTSRCSPRDGRVLLGAKGMGNGVNVQARVGTDADLQKLLARFKDKRRERLEPNLTSSSSSSSSLPSSSSLSSSSSSSSSSSFMYMGDGNPLLPKPGTEGYDEYFPSLSNSSKSPSAIEVNSFSSLGSSKSPSAIKVNSFPSSGNSSNSPSAQTVNSSSSSVTLETEEMEFVPAEEVNELGGGEYIPFFSSPSTSEQESPPPPGLSRDSSSSSSFSPYVPAPSSQSGLNGSSDAFVPGGSVVRYISGPALFLGAGEGWQGNFFSNMNKDTWMYEPSVLVNEDGGFVILQHPHPYLSAIYQWNYFLGAPMPWVAK